VGAAAPCERAAERARHGIAVAESIGLARTYGAIADSHLANALIGQRQWDEAANAVEHALDHTPAPVMHVPLVSLRATIALARGDTVPAEQALAFTREALSPGVRPPVDPWLPTRLEAELRLTPGPRRRGGHGQIAVTVVLRYRGPVPRS
jgi:hypothetical protein